MTTSTTDAEAIARIVSPDSWKIRDRHVAGANSDPGLTETERANALASAECYVQESLRRANAILSYLASRREAQEPADAQINSACMSFRHDFGLLDDAERDRVRFEAKEWLRAWQKEGFGCDRNEVIERCASIVDQCNREGPYQAIAAAPRIRALKDTAPPAPAGEVERLRGALDNCIDTLALVEQPSFIDKVYATDVAILGDRIGYGALMSCASALWRLRLSERGSPVGGEFVSGPCHATVLSTLKQARAALNGGRE